MHKSHLILIGIVITFYLSLLSCKKETFSHSPETISYPCNCCEIADSITGTFIGRLTEVDYSSYSTSNPTGDTILDTIIAIDVTRIYGISNPIFDSLNCQFDIPYFYDDPITMTNNSGNISPEYPASLDYDTEHFKYNELDSAFTMIIKKYTSVANNSNAWTHQSIDFKGIKQ